MKGSRPEMPHVSYPACRRRNGTTFSATGLNRAERLNRGRGGGGSSSGVNAALPPPGGGCLLMGVSGHTHRQRAGELIVAAQ